MTPAERDAPHLWRVRPDGCGMVAITLDALVVAMEPDAARRLAYALLAAADAAEERGGCTRLRCRGEVAAINLAAAYHPHRSNEP